MGRRVKEQRGDTIVEVMFAVAVFAMVAVGSLTIMNQGVAAAQRSLEVTLVQQQIQSQAEALRYLHDAYIAQYQPGAGVPTSGPAATWVNLLSTYGQASASPYGVTSGATCPDLPTAQGYHPFIMNAQLGTVSSQAPKMTPPNDGSLPPYAEVVYNGAQAQAYGMWIEAVPDGTSQAGVTSRYVDFHIRACWSTEGTNHPMTLGTIVRLYEPA